MRRIIPDVDGDAAADGDLDRTLLPRLSSDGVSDVPEMAALAARMERPWIDHHACWLGRYLHSLADRARSR